MRIQFAIEMRDAVGAITWLSDPSTSGVRRLTADKIARARFDTPAAALDALGQLASAIRLSQQYEVIEV